MAQKFDWLDFRRYNNVDQSIVVARFVVDYLNLKVADRRYSKLSLLKKALLHSS